ncbi:MAG: alpha/beta hydrolase, partial [Deferrisomatales bacterium]
VIDYRGYGRSGGAPTATALVRDAHRAFDGVRALLRARGRGGPTVVAGRSLGSVPALELAAARGWPEVGGLVVESGFAATLPLLAGLGLGHLGLTEADGFGNSEKIRAYPGPTLVIHGEQDRLLPVANARALFAAAGAADKRLLVIPGADHNSVFAEGLGEYLEAVVALAQRTAAG